MLQVVTEMPREEKWPHMPFAGQLLLFPAVALATVAACVAGIVATVVLMLYRAYLALDDKKWR